MNHLLRLIIVGAILSGFCCIALAVASKKIRVLVWSEGTEPQNIYPSGIRGAIADALKIDPNIVVSTASLKTPCLGLSSAELNHTDVLIWFGHEKHDQVPDAVAQRIVWHVKHRGMGFIALHSSHYSKPFESLLNATGSWADYQETGQPETIKIIAPDHPIAKNLLSFTIPQTEMFVEPFQVPQPDEVVMEGVWDKQHKSREVMTWTIDKGRVVYIRAGHETYPIYFLPQMQQLLKNTVYWVAKKS